MRGGNNKQYWIWVKNQRLQDIASEEAIGTPDELHMRILKKNLQEAQSKIDEIDGI